MKKKQKQKKRPEQGIRQPQQQHGKQVKQQQPERGPEKKHASRRSSPGKDSTGHTGEFLNRHMNLIGYVLLGILLVVIFHQFITGTFYYMFKDIGSDTVNLSYPYHVFISRYLRESGFPTWSHAAGMGQNIMSQSLMNPFTYLLYVAGPEYIPYTTVWMEIVKIVLAYVLFNRFLKLRKLTPLTSVLGAILFCFSSFMIAGGSWYQFSTEAFLIALLLLAFEQLYQKNSWVLFPLSIALICMIQPFDLYLFGLFLIIYFLFRHFSGEEPSRKMFFSVTMKLAGFTLLGVLISSFLLVSNIFLLLDSPRVGGESGYYRLLSSRPLFFLESEPYYVTSVMRLFANDLLGNGSNFKGWQNYLEAPLFYIGLFPLLIVPQFLIWSDKRMKITSCIFLMVFIIPVLFPYFRYAFWLFTGDYFRGFSFFVSLSILLMALFSLNELQKGLKLNILLLLGTLLLCVALLWYPYTNADQLINKSLRSGVTGFLIGYTLLFILYRFPAYRKGLNVLLVLLMAIEVGYINYGTVNERVAVSAREFGQKTGYNDYTVEAMDYIHSTDSSFFRVFKDYSSGPAMHQSINDALVQSFYGTSSYQSFNQKYYIRFLEEIEVVHRGNEHESRWAMGLGGRPLLLNLSSNRYLLTTNPNPPQLFRDLQYDSLTTMGNVRILKNRNFIPLGIVYRKYIPDTEFVSLSPFRKEICMQTACVLAEPVTEKVTKLEKYNLTDTNQVYTFEGYFSDVGKLRQDTLKLSYISEKEIRGGLEIKEPGILYFSIPFDRGWHAKIDGLDTEPMICNIGFMGFYLEPGGHSVELDYTPPYFTESLLLSIFGLLIYAGLIMGTIYLRKRRNVPDAGS